MRQLLKLSILSALGVVAPPLASASDGPAGVRQIIGAASQALADRDCAKVQSLLAPILAAPKAAAADDLSRAYDLSVTCALQTKDVAKAAEFAKLATALPTSSDDAWRIAVGLDLDARNFGAGIDTIDRMLAAGRKATLNGLDPRWLIRALFALQETGDAVNETRLLAILSNPSYDPDDVQAQIESIGDYVRALYARKLLVAGKRDDARTLLSEIKGYDTMAQVAFDPALSALLDRPVDLRAVVEADLARHRALLDRYPRALSAINEVSFDLRRLGRYDEDIAFLEAAIPRVEEPGIFDDGQDKVPWFWNALGYGYYMAGRYDAMAAAFAKGMQPNRDGSPNVDIILNFAGYQADFNRPGEALATLERLKGPASLSPAGLMHFHAVRGCAEAALGHLDAARADLAYALAHEGEAPAVVTMLQICVGDENAAAASFIRRLNDKNPATRQEAIFAVADFDPADARAPKSPFFDRTERVRKRPDVVAALRATTGGLTRVHVQFEP